MTVYVPQEPMYRNDKGEYVPKFQLSSVQVFGDTEILMPYGNIPLSIQPMVEKLRHKLRDFNDADYVLPIGDPVFIGVVVAIAAQWNGGNIKMLRWDRAKRLYNVVGVRL